MRGAETRGAGRPAGSMGRDIRRLLIGLLLVALPAAFVFLGVRGFVVRNAVVTASLDVAAAPIAGDIESIAIKLGEATAAESVAMSVRDPRSDQHDLDRLTADVERTMRSIETHQQSLQWYDQTLAALDEHLDATVKAMQLDLEAAAEALAANIDAAQARGERLTSDLQRVQKLKGTTASEASIEKVAADLKEAQAQLANLQAEERRLRQRIEFLDRSILVMGDIDDAVALVASIRDLSAQRHAVAHASAELENELEALAVELKSAEQQHSLLAQSDVHVPPNAVIWEIFVATGASVTAGQPLFSYANCEQRLTQVTIDDSTTELLRPDHPVTIYLYGEDVPIAGKVRSIYGSAAQITHSRTLAANVREVGITDAIVLIEMEPASDKSRQERLCDIGRTAYVEFEGIGFLDPLLNRLF